jgi:hypothetical protein
MTLIKQPQCHEASRLCYFAMFFGYDFTLNNKELKSKVFVAENQNTLRRTISEPH